MADENIDKSQSVSDDGKPPKWFSDYLENQKAQQTQSQQNPPPQNPPQQNRGYGPDLLNALNALPEKIVNAMKEQTPTTPPEKTNTETENSEKDNKSEPGESGKAKEDETKVPGRKSFADWWFTG